jgi:NAD(P)H-hydrate epimerase
LKVVDPALFNKNVVATPHVKEFEILFKEKPTPENVEKMAKKWGIVVLLKAKTDIICSPTECRTNETGNAGMTKGGTGDVLAGLVAALMCKNDNFLVARAGAYLNGLAGDRLKEKKGFWYSASELIEEIPLALKWCEGLN